MKFWKPFCIANVVTWNVFGKEVQTGSMKPNIGWLALLLLPGFATLASAESKINPIKFSDTRLDNGMRLIIAEDHYAPVYALAVSYAVGSKDEKPGHTGFAHLFEHMMFKGSQNVGAGEHFFLIFNYGGNMNGTTNTDRTIY